MCGLSIFGRRFPKESVFITVAFAGAVPGVALMNMIFSQYLFKIFIAMMDTPFVYLGVRALTGHWEIKEEHYAES